MQLLSRANFFKCLSIYGISNQYRFTFGDNKKDWAFLGWNSISSPSPTVEVGPCQGRIQALVCWGLKSGEWSREAPKLPVGPGQSPLVGGSESVWASGGGDVAGRGEPLDGKRFSVFELHLERPPLEHFVNFSLLF